MGEYLPSKEASLGFQAIANEPVITNALWADGCQYVRKRVDHDVIRVVHGYLVRLARCEPVEKYVKKVVGRLRRIVESTPTMKIGNAVDGSHQ